MTASMAEHGPYTKRNVQGNRFAYTITCDCGESMTLREQISGKTAEQVLPRKFGDRGWHVGKKRSKHRCPTCVSGKSTVPASPETIVAAIAEVTTKWPDIDLPPINLTNLGPAPAPKETPVSKSILKTLPPSLRILAPTTPAPAEPVQLAVVETPRLASLDERRIINEKLLDVYGAKGYTAAWSDTALAKDLGVPRAWVAQVREMCFGPDVNENDRAVDNALNEALLTAEAGHKALVALGARMAEELEQQFRLRLTESQKKLDIARDMVAKVGRR